MSVSPQDAARPQTRRVIQTSLGEVWLHGHWKSFHPSRALLFCVTSAFADPSDLDRLHLTLDSVDVVLARLPGNACPDLCEPSISRFAAAYDEAMAKALPGRSFAAMGLSAGGLVILAMTGPSAIVAADPPLTTDALWPVIPLLRIEAARRCDPVLDEWIWSIFGVSASAVENRDYRPLLEACRAPGFLLIPLEPLEPPREVSRTPGLMTSADREMAVSHPTLKPIFIAGCGHNVAKWAPVLLLRFIRAAIALVPTDEAARHSGAERLVAGVEDRAAAARLREAGTDEHGPRQRG